MGKGKSSTDSPKTLCIMDLMLKEKSSSSGFRDAKLEQIYVSQETDPAQQGKDAVRDTDRLSIAVFAEDNKHWFDEKNEESDTSEHQSMSSYHLLPADEWTYPSSAREKLIHEVLHIQTWKSKKLVS